MKNLALVLLAMLSFMPNFSAQDMSITDIKAPIIEPAKESAHPQWKKVWFAKLRKVSPRVSYGIGTFESSMRYKVPDLQNALIGAGNDLDNKYRWIPWNQIELQPTDPYRTKTLRKSGNFYFTGGINLPVFFLDIEAGVGRFSEPLLTVKEIFPLGETVSKEGFGELLLKRVTTPSKRGTLNMRLGIEAERVLPDHLLPRLEYGPFAIGIDAGAYYLLGADFSYRVGFEVVGEEAYEKITGVFDPIPLVPNNIKEEAITALLGHIESRIPAYPWAPAFQGYGLKGQVYLDIGKGLRIAGTYTHEKAFGLKLKGEWLNPGPQIWRNFFTIGIESKR
ncbi:MAG: hypothetical protein AAFR87_10765 [Bacteroidota bacterium]